MGYDSACTLRIGDTSARGTASLEQQELVFRGSFRLAIPLKDIAHASARDGTLLVRFGGRRAEFDLGRAAEKWASRILHPPSRLAKLGVKAGMRVALLDVDDAPFEDELKAAGILTPSRAVAGGSLDAVFLGVRTPADLDRLASLARVIQPAGAVWVVRRKGRDATVSESQSMAAGKRAGLVDVKVVSFSDTHTAEKYVIPVAARRAGGRRPVRTGETPAAARRARSV